MMLRLFWLGWDIEGLIMKIKDLIEKLEKLNPDASVMVLQEIPGSQHYSDNGQYEYELSEDFKVKVITDTWVELV